MRPGVLEREMRLAGGDPAPPRPQQPGQLGPQDFTAAGSHHRRREDLHHLRAGLQLSLSPPHEPAPSRPRAGGDQEQRRREDGRGGKSPVSGLAEGRPETVRVGEEVDHRPSRRPSLDQGAQAGHRCHFLSPSSP
ncbi:hypothetical protein RB196_19060 [Streptomyces sp. PmtA]|uniref:hypothetical protein n=1 Tax=Streptomyces sp. PmtA TaxID=3074275 RepID=UPI0030147D6A